MQLDRVIPPVYLIEEIGAGEPLPVGAVEGPVGVQQVELEHARALLPRLPQVPPDYN